MNNNIINCSVSSCNYNDEKGKCTLSNIQIGSINKNNNEINKEDTICNNFTKSVNQDYEIAEEILNALNH